MKRVYPYLGFLCLAVIIVLVWQQLHAKWITKTYPTYNFSVTVPADWKESDLGPMVSGVGFYAPGNENLNFRVAYAYPDSDPQGPIEEKARFDLRKVESVTVAGEQSYRGVFENPSLGLIQTEIYLEHDGVRYDLSFPTPQSATTTRILNSFTFIK